MGDSENISNSRIVWTPSNKETAIDRFRNKINNKYKLKLENYWDLHEWSVKESLHFWEEVWDFTGVIYSQPYNQVLDTKTKFEDGPEWFSGALLNFAENHFRRRDNSVAFYITDEASSEISSISYIQLYEDVRLYAAALKAAGIKKGDIVGAHMSTVLPSVEAMLATLSIGAIWTSVSIEYGTLGVIQRFQQIKPNILISVDSYQSDGVYHDILPKLETITNALPSLKTVVIAPYKKESMNRDISNIRKSCFLSTFLNSGRKPDGSVPPLEFAQVPFNHPAFICFTSGTTGPPKAIIHSGGGILLGQLLEQLLHKNGTDKDVLIFFSNVGWFTYIYLVGTLLTGGRSILYNGSSFYPEYSKVYDLIDKLGGTHLLTFPVHLDMLENAEIKPRKTHSLHTLHSVFSTGSCIKKNNWDYLHEHVKPDLYIASLMGSTDAGGCLSNANYSVPLYYGEIQSPNLGIALECWDDNGKPVLDKAGDMVITKPFPSMCLRYWNDPTKEKYKEAYFKKLPGAWSQGDLFLINSKTKGYQLLGRSDCMLNPSGNKFCSVEIYEIVEKFPEIEDSVCVSHYNSTGKESAVLFVKMNSGYAFSDTLVRNIKHTIESSLNEDYVPAVVLETKAIPYTASGKKTEVAIKKAINGDRKVSRVAMRNPEALDLFYDIPELKEL